VQVWTGQTTEFYRNIIKVLASNEVQAYNLNSVSGNLSMYYAQFVNVCLDLLQVSIFPLLFILIFFASVNSKNAVKVNAKRTVRIQADLPRFLFLFYFAYVIYKYPFDLSNKWGTIGNFTIGLFFVNLSFTLYLLMSENTPRKHFLFLILLNCLPFLQAFGTSNPIGGQTMFGNIGVVATSLVIFLRIFQDDLHTMVTLCLATVVTSLVSASLIHGTTDGMYRVAPIQQLSSEISNVHALDGILVTQEDSTRYTWLVDRVSQLPQNTVYVPLVVAGYNFAFKNTGFSSPWMDAFSPVTFSNLKKSCEAVNSGKSSIVIIRPSEVSEDMWPFLNNSLVGCGLKFPDSFELDSEDPTKAIQIWVSKSLI
jgi:hypothetical protein